MRKIKKTMSIMMAAMIVSLTAASIAGAVTAEEKDVGEDGYSGAYLDGGIDVKLDGFIGVVSPVINITEDQENQTVTFLVNVTEDPENPENSTYDVEDELRINLTITDESGRASFLLPRSLIYGYIFVRDPSTVPIRPIFGYLKRLFPVRKLLNSVPVADTLLGSSKADNITIPISYSLANTTYEAGSENMTLHIFTMGFLPGNSNGFSEKLPIVDHVKINLEIHYEEK